MNLRIRSAAGLVAMLIGAQCGGASDPSEQWTATLALETRTAAPDYTAANYDVEPPEFLRIYVPRDEAGVAKPHNANWGGIAGADAYCNLSHASKPSDPVGSFKALLVDGFYRVATTEPVVYFDDVAVGQTDWPLLAHQFYKDMDGNVIGKTTDQAFFGVYLQNDIHAAHPLKRALIWTGLKNDWTLNKQMHCSGWTSAASTGYGQVGNSYSTVNAFSYGHEHCHEDQTVHPGGDVSPHTLYCVEQPAELLFQPPEWNWVLNEFVLWIPPCDITPAGRSVVVRTAAPAGARIYISTARDGNDLLERARMRSEVAPPNGAYAIGDVSQAPRQGEAVVRNQQVVYTAGARASGSDRFAYTSLGDAGGPGCTVELTVDLVR